MEKNWQYQTGFQNTVTEEVIADRRLWIAVLISAVEDWRSGNLRAKRNAQKFLFDSDADFQTVCTRAGVDPVSFRAKLLKVGKTIELYTTFDPPVSA
jgi:hypothetical protein